MMFKIHLLPASFGDAILVEYGEREDPKYILIDGGPYFVFDDILDSLRRVAPGLKELELVVVTHIDIDHIDGIIMLLNADRNPVKINQIWFNGWKQIELAQRDILGGKQGEYLSALIKDRKIPHNVYFDGGPVGIQSGNFPGVIRLGNVGFTLLSPSYTSLIELAKDWNRVVKDVGDSNRALLRLGEDRRYRYEDDLLGEIDIDLLQETTEYSDASKANGSSIAFLMEYNQRRCLFAADAHSNQLEEIVKSILKIEKKDRLQVDAWKIGHHGSCKTTLSGLMKLIDCKRFLLSTDGKRYSHPDDELIAKLIKYNAPGAVFYFNYRTKSTEIWDNDDWKSRYGYEVKYPSHGDCGISVDLFHSNLLKGDQIVE